MSSFNSRSLFWFNIEWRFKGPDPRHSMESTGQMLLTWLHFIHRHGLDFPRFHRQLSFFISNAPPLYLIMMEQLQQPQFSFRRPLNYLPKYLFLILLYNTILRLKHIAFWFTNLESNCSIKTHIIRYILSCVSFLNN